MNAIVFEHVPVNELPQAWREKLGRELADAAGARVTVRIEQEPANSAVDETFVTDDPAFGIWRDHEQTADVEGYVRHIRAGPATSSTSHQSPPC